jgi:hypothetical protein
MKQKICNSIAVLVLSFSKISFSQYYDPHNLNPQEWDVFAAQSRERQERQLSLDASARGDFIAAGVHSHQADSARLDSIMLDQRREENERIARQRKIEEEQSWQYANQNVASHIINNKMFVHSENNNDCQEDEEQDSNEYDGSESRIRPFNNRYALSRYTLYNGRFQEEKRRIMNDKNYRRRRFEAERRADEFYRNWCEQNRKKRKLE